MARLSCHKKLHTREENNGVCVETIGPSGDPLVNDLKNGHAQSGCTDINQI